MENVLTQFPNLWNTYHEEVVRNNPQHEVIVEGIHDLSDEILIISWAVLLKAYTENDVLSFLFNGKDVSVESNTWTICERKDEIVRGSNATAIYTSSSLQEGMILDSTAWDSADLHSLAVAFHYCSSKCCGQLSTSGAVPAEHLSEIGYQLRSVIEWTLSEKGYRLQLKARTVTPRCSITNKCPETLEGPRLLHHLPNVVNTSNPAIDFLESDGRRVILSYQMLQVRSTALAMKISAMLKPTDHHRSKPMIIPVLIPQSAELYVALLAILKAGAAFCPMDIDAPEARLSFVLSDVSATMVVTTASCQNKIPSSSCLSVCLVDLDYEIAPHEHTITLQSPSPQDLAYVIYTSGSTGQPKGVCISHFAITQALLAHDLVIPYFSRFLQFASPTFDVSLYEIFFPLFRGSTIVGCTRTKLINNLPEIINQLEVDAAELTPTVAGSLLRNRDQVPGLRLLLTIGEMLTVRVIKSYGGTRQVSSILWGMYGPTETAIHCTLYQEFEASSKVGLIGYPLASVSALIISPVPSSGDPGQVEPLPIGHIGELAIGGHQLASGYLNREEETKVAFISHTTYGQLYRTGDKARMLPSGMIEYLGRITSGQVKLRGQRIELGEIERAAAEVVGCQLAVASVIDSNIILFCLISSDHLSKEQILKACRNWLPSYMVPGDVVLITDIPRLSSGKVDKKTLETLYTNATHRPTESSHFNDETERELYESACIVLGSRIDPSTSLFSQGLDSLSAIRLASSLRSKGFGLGAMDIISATTMRELYTTLKNRSGQRTAEDTMYERTCKALNDSIISHPRLSSLSSEFSDILPCTPLQTSMLAETALDPQAYTNTIELEFDQCYSLQDIKTAFGLLVAAHDILRSGFVIAENSESPYAQVVWKVLDSQQVLCVDEFDRTFQFSDEESLLRPLILQLKIGCVGCRALITLHHALYDGWSLDLMVKQWHDILRGRQIPKRQQFSKVIQHYCSLMHHSTLEPAIDYWTAYMEGYHPMTLPNLTGFQKTSPSGLQTARRILSLQFENTRDYLHRIQPQAVFQAALVYLLSLYHDTSDMAIGTVTSGRTIPVDGIEEVIGPCVATVPLRLQILKDFTAAELIRNVHATNLAMLQHCELPLRDIKQLCGSEPGSRLFDVLFVWQETLESRGREHTGVRQVDHTDHLEYNLILEVDPCSKHIVLTARYRESFWPSAHMEIFLQQLEEVVSQFIILSEITLGDIDSRMSDNVLSIANPAPTKRTTRNSLATYVENVVHKHPARMAIKIAATRDGELMQAETMTYYELNTKANRLAHFLTAQGVMPDHLVGILLDKSLDLYVSILATIKAGAGYLPLTPDTPESRVEVILREANVRVCLTRSTAPTVVKNTGLAIYIDVNRLDLNVFSPENLSMPFIASNLAYAVFTSGSTGMPKGVLVTQDNLTSNIETLAEIYPVTPNSRLLQACSQAFDVSVFEIFFAWYSGMCLCSGTNDVLFRDLEDAIRFFDVTHLSLTPTVAALVDPANVPGVQFLVTSGEGVTETVFRKWAGNGLFHGYGPSETTNICSVKPNILPIHSRDNVGPPLLNTSAFVALPSDSELKVLPRGAVGELCFGGDQVFRGYLKMSDLNARKIYDHSRFGRLFRSGDAGRILHDNSIIVLARLDDQVKIRGQRVELGEISHIMLRSDAVQDCVTMIMEKGADMDERLVSFFIPKNRAVATAGHNLPANAETIDLISTLFRNLAQELNTYMIPSLLVPVDKLPMTVQGKIDKNQLATLYKGLEPRYLDTISQISQGHDTAADEKLSEFEQQIAGVLAATLNIDISNIRRQTSFFSLGLDSVSAIRMAKLLRSQSGITVSISTILRHPNVARLAATIVEPSNQDTQGPGQKRTSIEFDDLLLSSIKLAFTGDLESIESIRPCTPLQDAMLYADTSTSKNTTYSHNSLFSIKGSMKDMEQSWRLMCQRHEILRTCFLAIEDSAFGFAQVVLSEYNLPWETVHAPHQDMKQLIQQWREHQLVAADTHVPPVSIKALITGNEAHLLLQMHHALYDAEAMSQLLYEVEQTLRGESLPHAISFEPFLQQALSDNYAKADAYWDQLLRDYVSFPFPGMCNIKNLNSVPPAACSISCHTLQMSLGDLKRASKDFSVTLLSLCQAAWVKVLSMCLDEVDVCFGNVVSGRSIVIEGIERLVAPCFNTVPIRIKVIPGNNNVDLVHQLQKINAEILEYQFSPLRRIQSRWSQRGQRLFDTLFILQKPHRRLDESVWSLVEESGYMGFPVACELVPDQRNNKIDLKLHSESSVISDELVSRLIDMYDAALANCVNHPNAMALILEDNELINLCQTTNDQIYIRGKPVRLDDLRTRIYQTMPEVEHAAILATNLSARGCDEVAVFLTLHGNSDLDVHNAVLETAASVLGKSIPTGVPLPRILIIDKMPLSHSGQPSRKALLTKLRNSDEKKRLQESAPPSKHRVDSIELAVREAYAKFAKVPVNHTSWDKTMFQLGLDSINAIQVAQVLRAQDYQLSAADVLARPTSAGLAALLRSQSQEKALTQPTFNLEAFDKQHRAEICKGLHIQDSAIESVRPCTSSQAGMVAKFLHSEGRMYFNHVQYTIHPGINLEKLKGAWQQVLKKHDMLRTGFVTLNRAQHPFAMVCYRAADTKLPWFECGHASDPVQDLGEMQRKAAEEATQNFHFPPWRISINKCSQARSILLLSAHHALYDARSLQRLLKDVEAHYMEVQLNPTQPIDHALSGILFANQISNEDEDYWTSLLLDCTVNRFPNMLSVRKNDRMVCTASKLSDYTVSELENACRELGISLQAALQVSWAQILSAYSGNNDIIFGVVLSGRDTKTTDHVAFPCATTVPFRSNAQEDINLSLSHAMSFNSSVRRHQYTPLTQLQRWAGSPEEPLFDTILVYQRLDEDTEQNALLTVVEELATVEYPVSLEIKSSGQGTLSFHLIFWDDVVPAQQASLLLTQFNMILSRRVLGMSEPDTPGPSDLPLEVLSLRNPLECDIPSPFRMLCDLIDISARTWPKKVGFEFVPGFGGGVKPQRWTYQDLSQKSSQMANLLQSRGVIQGSLVAICFDKCPEAYFAILGILKAGCAFLALDPSAPVARKKFMLEDSKAPLILTVSTLAQAFNKNTDVPILCVENINFDALSTQYLSSSVSDKTATCYCLYTSGSTGTPKGCLISHENVVQALLSFQRIFTGRWKENSRWLQFASFHFDVSVLELFWSWMVGICVVSIPRDVLFEDLADSLRRLDITHIDLTPSLARLITPEEVPSLCPGVFITGGEQLKQEILNVWGNTGVIHNGYGPTGNVTSGPLKISLTVIPECTIGVTMYPGVPSHGKPSNIGWQFDNVGTYVVHPDTTDLVLKGGIGELCIFGKLVGKGYLNRPELTAERFPYIDRFSQRIYRTGDLVRCLHDGSFEFLGRIDDQIKLRGQRLELGEVNSAILASCKEIRDVTTLVLKQLQEHTEQLVSFVVSNDSAKQTKFLDVLQDPGLMDRVRSTCQDRLPQYMIPSHFVMINEIPLTTNNKVDTRSLRKLFLERTNGIPNAITVPKVELSPPERKIIKALEHSLDLSIGEASSSSNIFQIGLDSISVFGFARALKEEGFASAHPAIIMRNNTVSSLSKALASEAFFDGSVIAAKQSLAACQRRHRVSAAERLSVEVDDVQAVAPCTPLQQGMIARSLKSAVGLYFNTFQFELMPNIEADQLQSAWIAIYQDLQILRTRFLISQDGYIQVILREKGNEANQPRPNSQDSQLPWTSVDLPENANLTAFVAKCREDWYQHNEEIISNTIKLILATHRRQRYVILLIFHGIYDAASLPLLFRCVAERYYRNTSVIHGPQYLDVLPYGPLRQADGARSFWRTTLADFQFTPLPALITSNKSVTYVDYKSNKGDKSTPLRSEDPAPSGTCSASIDLHSPESVESIRKKLNVTYQALVQACWLLVIQSHIGAPTTLGIVVSGRSINIEGAEKTIGPLFNTLPMYIPVNRNDSWRSIVHKCHNFNVITLPFQHSSLHDISQWCRKATHQPLFDTLFVFQRNMQTADSTPNILWKQLPGTVEADYPLSFEAEQTEHDKLRVTIVAQAAFADDETCASLLQNFRKNLMTLIKDPDATAGDSSVDVDFRHRDVKDPAAPVVNDVHKTDWTTAACLVQDEVAKLAQIVPGMISEDTSLFELGLDSVDIIRLTSQLRTKGIQIAVSTIMRNPTVAGIMKQHSLLSPLEDNSIDSHNMSFRRISEKLWKYVVRALPETHDIEDILPATPLQEAMVAEMYRSNFTNYFNHDVLQLAPSVDIDRFKQAWTTVVACSPILRTSFVEIEDPSIPYAYVQVVYRQKTPSWNTIKMSTPDDFTAFFENAIRDMQIDTPKSSLFKLTFIESVDSQYCVLSIAHALYDGCSIGLLHEDVQRAYSADLTYRPYYRHHLQQILNAAGPAAERYWLGVVSSTTSSTLPSRPSEAVLKHKIHREELKSMVAMDKIQAFCRRQQVTLQALGQTGYSFVLASYIRKLDVMYGVVLSGRDDAELQKIMFPTMNTVAVRSIIHGTRADMLERMQVNLADMIQYQAFPLRRIQKLAGFEGRRFFDTLFMYQRQSETSANGNALYKSVGGLSAIEYPLCVEMEVVHNKLVWRAACEDSVLSADGVSNLLRRLDTVLAAIIDDPDVPAIEFGKNGASVCGLPAFDIEEQLSSSTAMIDNQRYFNHLVDEVWSPAEQTVREVLAVVSGVAQEHISKRDTIFHLGLDSITAIKAAALLRKRFMQFSVSDILRAGSVAKIAAMKGQQAIKFEARDRQRQIQQMVRSNLEHLSMKAIIEGAGHTMVNVEEVLPATPGQVYFLLMWQKSRGILFNPTFTYQVHGLDEVQVLHDAWSELTAHNPILRTIFLATGDHNIPVVQIIFKEVANTFFTSTSDESFRPDCDAAATAPCVYMSAEKQANLVTVKLRIHHALYDAVSLPLLIHELQIYCNKGIVSNRSEGQFSQFITLGMSDEARRSRRTFWTEYLKGLDVKPSPDDDDTWCEKRLEVYKPHAIANVSTLEASLRENGLSIQSLFLASVAAVYADHVNAVNDIVFGVYLANRSHPLDGLATLAVPTVNMIPLKARSPLQTPVLSLAKQMQDDLQDIGNMENSCVSLWEIEEWTGVTVDCFVNFLKLPENDDRTDNGSQEKPDEAVIIQKVNTVDEGDAETTNTCLMPNVSTSSHAFRPSIDIEAAVRDGGLDIGIFAPENVLPRSTAECMLEALQRRVQSIIQPF